MYAAGGSVKPAWLWCIPLVLLAAASRVPQLASPHLILDGDEAVLGLMARHLLDGREWPWFFDGQAYGLSTVEAAAGAAAFAVAGASAVPLKVAMLALWLVGVLAHQRALARLIGGARATVSAALLVLMPAWAVWSMKARGGYLTAFAAAGVALLLLLVRLIERRDETAHVHRAVHDVTWVSVGALVGLIFFAQRLWLPGLVPAVAAASWLDRRRPRGLFALAAGACGVVAAVKVGSGLTWPLLFSAPRGRNPDLLASVHLFFERLYTAFTGSYYLWKPAEPGPVTKLLAAISAGVLLILVVIQVYRLVSRQWLPWSHGCAAAVVLTLGTIWLLIDAPDARYLLPVMAWMWCWAAIEAHDFAREQVGAARGLTAAAGVLLVLGVVSCVEFRGYTYLWNRSVPQVPEEAALDEVLDHLRARGVQHVFATNGLLQWQITFYSGETIVARYFSDRDRYQPYITAVDAAFESGAPVAMVGYIRSSPDIEAAVDASTLLVVQDRYFVYIDPDETLLRQMGFRFFKDRG